MRTIVVKLVKLPVLPTRVHEREVEKRERETFGNEGRRTNQEG